MNKILFTISIILSILINYMVFIDYKKPKTNFSYQKINDNPVTDIKIISDINKKNNSITNLSCKDIEVFIWDKGMRFKLDGSIYYEKPKNLKFKIGKEFFIGSNNDEFWYWSKRLKPPALYYAKHEDYYKTLLKPSFSPMTIIESMCIHEIKLNEKMDIQYIDDKIAIVEKSLDTLNRDIVKITFINPKLENIVGQVITDIDGNLMASVEVLKYENNVPQEILYTHENNQVMLVKLNNVLINQEISKDTWIKPVLDENIDISLE